jgi:hypothetical protein
MKDESASVHAEVVRLPGATGEALWLLRAEGPLETADHPLFDRIMESPHGCHHVAVDLSLVQVLSAAGASGVLRCGHGLGESGRRLFVACAGPAVTQVLDLTRTRDVVTVLPTVRDVVAACTPPAPDGAGQTLLLPPDGDAENEPDSDELRARLRDLRGKVRSYPLIAQAQGVLLERYDLDGPQSAFDLLRDASQRHNVKLRSLAAAVLTVPRPEARAKAWFPGRGRTAAPVLDFLPGPRTDRINRGVVIGGVLERAMDITGTRMGNVQLVDPVTGDLRMERHEGLSDRFVEFFDVVADGTSCALAARHGSRVTVTDVATDPVFDEPARDVILAAGSRASHSVPLVSESGCCLGMVSTHVPRPVQALSASQARALDALGDQAGRWLAWYQRTVVFDALEHLHRRAGSCTRAAPGAYASAQE